MIKHISLAFLFIVLILTSFAQERKDLVIGISGGKLTSPYYSKNTIGSYYGIDFDYYLSKQHILSVNYNYGEHRYYDKILSTDPSYHREDGTNATAGYQTFSVLYKNKFLHSKQITGAIGTGVGIMTYSNEYPVVTSTGSIFRKSVNTDLVFPVRLEFDYSLPKNFRFGLIGGFFIHPDFPILAYHLGPRLSYVIR